MSCEVIHGNGWKVLPMLKERSERFHAFVTDPPYSSGGMFRGDRASCPVDKYVLNKSEREYVPFSGDNRDQRSWFRFCVEWMSDLHELAEPGAVMLTFIDWRQLPTMTDAIQCAGWVWRGIMPWNKTEGVRPQRGFYRSQCEYILAATNGTMGKEQTRASEVCAPGFFTWPVRVQDKHHPTGKPVELMRDLLGILPRGSRVLDPFAGSGSTGVACLELGYDGLLIEMEEPYCDIIRRRLEGVKPRADHVQPQLL